jgi:DNA-binding transcriptional ArsR family regulator
MESTVAINALSALAQETRLAVFRLLVQAGPTGLAAGQIAERLAIAAPTLSFHLSHLSHAGLVSCRRMSRSLIYAANYTAMNELVSFLTENCCGGSVQCAPVCSPSTPIEIEVQDEALARPRRRR